MKVGDIISTTNNETSTIICVVKNCSRNGFNKFIQIGEAILTPNHPVKLNQKWIRPEELVNMPSMADNVKKLNMNINEVYNFIVDKRSSIYLNDTEVSTLGQFCEGIDDENTYFGSERVVDYLKSLQLYPNITLYSNVQS